MSLHARLAGLIALTVAVALVAQGLFGYLEFRQTALRDVNTDLDTYLASFVRDQAEGESLRAVASESGIRARLLKNGKPMQEFGGAFPNTSDADGDTSWIIRRTPLPALGPGTELEATLPLHAYHLGVNAYLRTVLYSVTVMSVLGAAVAALLSRGALKPLDHMLDITEQVTASGDLSARVPLPQGGGEVARLARTFNAMLERLQAFRQRETEFTRHAAHELRTPLTALRVQLDAHRHGWVSDDEILQTADEQVTRLTHLTTALLTLARENRAELVPFDIGACTQSLARRHGAAYDGPAHVQLRGNEALLTQALENLLLNAARHAPGASIRLQVQTRANRVYVSVEDEGPGVPGAALAHLGKEFYRAPGSVTDGSGLGLAVVARICQVHGGVLQVQPVTPHGLRITLNLSGDAGLSGWLTDVPALARRP
ncbi:signal transduction histidine kinase [Deinococcus metalli]|uniref:histidine kinase n=1 Tax=Deinococcus metalli TaxID=1141878 RepID=A0A7W8NT47_9DEIO|nr:ATP-binding protein [Deinococcus metalli]MBB5378693.1 signal transduction histidine kinase [Deinococcus metalli]GHF61751.1 two-component sensor histidine kinase [Deinococcus metalli]